MLDSTIPWWQGSEGGSFKKALGEAFYAGQSSIRLYWWLHIQCINGGAPLVDRYIDAAS